LHFVVFTFFQLICSTSCCSHAFFIAHNEDSDSAADIHVTRGASRRGRSADQPATRGRGRGRRHDVGHDEDSMRTDATAEIDQGKNQHAHCILLFSILFELIY
jgi:hypothetical protein